MRAPLVFEVKDANGNVVLNAAVAIRDRVTGALVALYDSETADLPDSNPTLPDSTGRVVTWAERGDYVATVTGSGITPYTMPIDSTPAGDGAVDTTWLSSSVNLFPWRGIYTPAVETTTSASYVSLATPDSILDVVVPTANSIIGFAGMFLSKGSGTAVASCNLYVNGVPAKHNNGIGGYIDLTGGAGNQSSANIYTMSSTTGAGWAATGAGTDYAVDPATGTAMSTGNGGAGPCWLYVPDAGVYDFELKFQIASGQTLSVKERRMFIWVVG